jgi:predicted site-specific integrase-resolvase
MGRPEATMPTFINKDQVRQLFGGVSKGTIDRWVSDGKLPKPTKRFLRQRWSYEELVNLLKAKGSEKKLD